MNIITFDEIDSTNNYAKSNMVDLADKTVISASYQTAGRGRFTRSWVDLGADNIYMTIILKPSSKMEEVYANLTQFLSITLCKQLESMNLKPTIKWPNDVLLSGKKVCGILAESVIKGGILQGIALGIGVNLNASRVDLHQIDRPATSVNLELWEDVDKNSFMTELLERFFAGYDEFLSEGFLSIKSEYEKRASYLGEEVTVAIFKDTKKGIFKGFDNNGALMLADLSGECQSINMGELV